MKDFIALIKVIQRKQEVQDWDLSIVKHGAILHNAKIDIDSVLNKGTAITLTFEKAI